MKHYKILFICVVAVTAIYIGRISYIQLFTERYRLNGENTSIKPEYEIPLRGVIMDRKGRILVGNMLTYELNYTQSMMDDSFDTIQFCKLVDITKQEFIEKITPLNSKRSYQKSIPKVFLKNLERKDVARIQEKLYRYPAFSLGRRPERSYLVETAGNVLGYINEVNDAYIKRDSLYYLPGDLAGMAGVEKSYEAELRGVKGVKYYKKDIHQQNIGSYEDGKYDIDAQSGKDLMLSIDYELQALAEELLEGKWGAAVAIDPKTGEILCMASAPTINPKALTGKYKQHNLYQLLNDSMRKPMYDRAVQAAYPPGSTFKLLNGLVGQQLGVITDSTAYACRHGSRIGRRFVKCHDAGMIRLVPGIQNSCNSYFCKSYIGMLEKDSANVEKGLDEWNKLISSFGLNSYFGNDLAVGNKGNIPDSKFYNQWYSKGGWNAYSIFSNGIGQGEVLTTPLQMANFVSAIANKGFYYTPHIVKEIDGKPIENSNFTKPKKTLVDEKYFPKVIQGMSQVVTNGTARGILTKSFTQAGKTGTSQVPHGARDHSNFVLFAPVENPKIAIAVVVENGGFGATSAAPIATLLAEKYLLNKIERTYLVERLKKMNLYGQYRKNYINKLKAKGWYVAPDTIKADSLKVDNKRKN
ncbi:MAG: peptidoglycan glycosyltransferase [Flavobacteriales bacterium]|nr:peptidoglycan glycosyltransferase [Flavobacteriales bacterium]